MAPKLLVYASQMWDWVSSFVQNPLLLDRALYSLVWTCNGRIL